MTPLQTVSVRRTLPQHRRSLGSVAAFDVPSKVERAVLLVLEQAVGELGWHGDAPTLTLDDKPAGAERELDVVVGDAVVRFVRTGWIASRTSATYSKTRSIPARRWSRSRPERRERRRQWGRCPRSLWPRGRRGVSRSGLTRGAIRCRGHPGFESVLEVADERASVSRSQPASGDHDEADSDENRHGYGGRRLRHRWRFGAHAGDSFPIGEVADSQTPFQTVYGRRLITPGHGETAARSSRPPGRSYVMIDDAACKIDAYSTAKPGKHGSAKARVEASGVFDGKKRSFSQPVDAKVWVPIIERKQGRSSPSTATTCRSWTSKPTRRSPCASPTGRRFARRRDRVPRDGRPAKDRLMFPGRLMNARCSTRRPMPAEPVTSPRTGRSPTVEARTSWSSVRPGRIDDLSAGDAVRPRRIRTFAETFDDYDRRTDQYFRNSASSTTATSTPGTTRKRTSSTSRGRSRTSSGTTRFR